MLALPDVRQRFDYDCGAAATKTVLSFYGLKTNTYVLAPLATNPIDGTDPRAIEATLRRSGLKVISGEMDLDDLKHHTKLGRPVICLIQLENVGHYVVVGSVKFNQVHFNDPTNGPSKNNLTKFKDRWKDVDRLNTTYHQFGIAAWRQS
jgi:ABC-type bacteriocin/lantibiotic exporter with double-glycine peptidase domain